MRRLFLVGLLGTFFFSGCLRLSVDEVREWRCDKDADCKGGYLCKKEGYMPATCRPPEWCEDDDNCKSTQLCVSSTCVDKGGTDGACVSTADCAAGFRCSSGCEEESYSCETGLCECSPSAETCNDRDDDCDGEVDEGFDLGAACTGKGACGAGKIECGTDGATICSTEAGGSEFQAKPETCNGVDDDCDGETDEGLGTVTCGESVCENTIEKCKNGAIQTCEPLAANPDVCGDGIDNDCDGTPDNDESLWVSVATDTVNDNCAGLMWQKGRSDDTLSPDPAAEYCDTMELGGFSDWRVPSYDEVISLICGPDPNDPFETVCAPCAENTKCNSMFPSEGSFTYRSTSSTQYVDYGKGEVRTGTIYGYASVRCVRNL